MSITDYWPFNVLDDSPEGSVEKKTNECEDEEDQEQEYELGMVKKPETAEGTCEAYDYTVFWSNGTTEFLSGVDVEYRDGGVEIFEPTGEFESYVPYSSSESTYYVQPDRESVRFIPYDKIDDIQKEDTREVHIEGSGMVFVERWLPITEDEDS